MEAGIRVVSFDCYGTLIDSEGGAGGFLYDLSVRHDDPELRPGLELAARWEEIQFDLLEPYRPYKDVLRESLRRHMDERGYRWSDAEGDAFVRSMRSWQPFVDVWPVLTSIHDLGVRLVIISNTDRDIIEHSLRHLRAPIDDVITAEDCGVYKPSHHVFEYALAQLDVEPQAILHVAFGFKYDIGPAQRMGVRTGWVNRRNEPRPGPERPDYEWIGLWGLAALLQAPQASHA